MAKLFISYSRKDIDFVRKLAGDLEKAGYDVWWDLSDLRGGDDWVNTIPAAIASSQYVIVVLTPDATESEWVRKEYTQALSLRRKIIPILLKPGKNQNVGIASVNRDIANQHSKSPLILTHHIAFTEDGRQHAIEA